MRYLVVGGAGFIGSHCVDYLLSLSDTNYVCVYDNLTSGHLWHLELHENDSRLKTIHKDIYDLDIYDAAINIDIVFLFAANPDISKAVTEPSIDFHQGTALTQIVLEAMRKANCRRLVYSSGSGVYGDCGDKYVDEEHSPLQPISTYGASKLSCEALISSYCFMFGMKASIFRFGNVVGARQTHGVAYDFINRIKKNNSVLNILGDGNQSKPYVHVSDVISAINIVLKMQSSKFDVYNVAPEDFTKVTDIALLVLNQFTISKNSCNFIYSGGDRGWKGDVPLVRLSTKKIRYLGWINKYSSYKAIEKSIYEIYQYTIK